MSRWIDSPHVAFQVLARSSEHLKQVLQADSYRLVTKLPAIELMEEPTFLGGGVLGEVWYRILLSPEQFNDCAMKLKILEQWDAIGGYFQDSLWCNS